MASHLLLLVIFCAFVSIVFAVATLVTGSLWARAAWGHWWVWDEPVLVSFLVIFLLYACYQPLRFAIEDPERQARFAAVFALLTVLAIGVALLFLLR